RTACRVGYHARVVKVAVKMNPPKMTEAEVEVPDESRGDEGDRNGGRLGPPTCTTDCGRQHEREARPTPPNPIALGRPRRGHRLPRARSAVETWRRAARGATADHRRVCKPASF